MSKYQKICRELLENVSERSRDILVRRYGLEKKEKETLEFIGEGYQITRERVRQIEADAMKQIKKITAKHQDFFDSFKEKIDSFGGLKREDLFISSLIEEKNDENCIVFLLNFSRDLFHIPETEKTHSFWTNEKEVICLVNKIVEDSYEKIKEKNHSISPEELNEKEEISLEKLISSLEISKLIGRDGDDRFGLYEWPEINPRGIRDRAYLAVKKENKPLHFKKVTELIGEGANSQTVHNELIKDPRFVLVGRGIYALAKWGYVPGEVKDVICSILKEEGSLEKDEIVSRVFEQRVVKKNTIVQNLSNKKYFIRTPDGKYTLA